MKSSNNKNQLPNFSEKKIIDFSKFQPKISIRIVLFGFYSNQISELLGQFLNQFLESKQFGKKIQIPPIHSLKRSNYDEFTKNYNDYLNISFKFSIFF